MALYVANESGRFPACARSAFEAFLDRNPRGLAVAELDGRVVGCGALEVGIDGAATLAYGLVHPEYQGRRIGTTLILLRLARSVPHANGVVAAIFSVDRAIEFYRRLGFLVVGTWKSTEGDHPWALLRLPPESIRRIARTLASRGVSIRGDYDPAASGETIARVNWGKRDRAFFIVVPRR